MVWRLAWRGLWRNKRRTAITVSSIAFGLAVALFFVSLGEGVYRRMIDLAVNMQAGRLTLERAGYRAAPAVGLYLDGAEASRRRLAGLPGVVRAKLLVLGQGMAQTAGNSAGVEVMGVEPALEAAASPLARRITAGRYLKQGDRGKVVVGRSLAQRLHLSPGRKLVITVNTAQGELTNMLFRVAGIFHTGGQEVDAALLQMPIAQARALFGLPAGAASQVGLVLADYNLQERAAALAAPLVPRGAVLLSWREVLPELASYIRLDRTSNHVFQALLIALVLFTIFNTLLMSVMEREREFAVLMSLGAPPSLLSRQIMAESLFLGLLGTTAGLALGAGAAGAMARWGLDLSHFLSEGITISGVSLGSRLKSALTWGQVITLGGLVLAATLLLSVFPVWRARRVRLVEELR